MGSFSSTVSDFGGLGDLGSPNTVRQPEQLTPPSTTTQRQSIIQNASIFPPADDVSDVNVQNIALSSAPLLQLPMRAEKRFIPTSMTTGLATLPITPNIPQGNQISTLDFFTTAAAKDYTNHIMVRIPHRGKSTGGQSNPSNDATYRFLINPQTVQISRNTEDSQTFARGGWQFGLWGESLIRVSMVGHTPGQYFSLGITDQYAPLTASWRNLQQLQMVYENNGYWFEGEEINEGPLAPGYARRHIKKHQDIVLIVGNFMWYGMFDEFSITLDAEHPFRAEFRLTFLAWRERFRSTSPYAGYGVRNDVERGNSYGAYSYTAQEQAAAASAGQMTSVPQSSSLPEGYAASTIMSEQEYEATKGFIDSDVSPNAPTPIPSVAAAAMNDISTGEGGFNPLLNAQGAQGFGLFR
jgi:hypothetical protein